MRSIDSVGQGYDKRIDHADGSYTELWGDVKIRHWPNGDGSYRWQAQYSDGHKGELMNDTREVNNGKDSEAVL